MCDGRPPRLPAFSPPGGSRRLFLRFPVSMGPTLCVLFDSRCCFTLITSCLLFSALWLRCNQSLLVQETQPAKDFDLTCSTTFMFRDATCLQVGPMSLDWPVNPFGRSDPSRSSLSPVANNNSVLYQLLYAPAGDRMLFKHNRRYYNVPQGGMDVAPSFPKACDVFAGKMVLQYSQSLLPDSSSFSKG